MSLFIVTRKFDGAEVYRYQSEAPIEWNGMEFAICDHVIAPMVNDAVGIEAHPVKRRLTKLEFVERLGGAALAAILQMSKTSTAMEAWILKMQITTPDPDGTSVDLDDPRTVSGVVEIGMALEAQGVVPAGWADGVLA